MVYELLEIRKQRSAFICAIFAQRVDVHYKWVLFQGTTLVEVSLVLKRLPASIWPGINQAVTHKVGTEMTC